MANLSRYDERREEIAFYFPGRSRAFSILGVFLIVVITMFYAIEKIKKENIIEALRDDLT